LIWEAEMLDDLDFQLIDALQRAPRASWSALSPVLRTDPSTLSRRWSTMVAAGLAWTTCYVLPERMQLRSPNGEQLRSSTAVVEVRCEPGQRELVLSALKDQGAVINVECTTGSRDLSLTVASSTPRHIDSYVAEHIGVLPGVVSTSTSFVRRFFREGSEWTLDFLRTEQMVAVDKLAHHSTVVGPAGHDNLIEDVIRALQPNVRRSAAEVAQQLGISIALARRGIASVARSDWVRMRADFAHDVVGWNASVHLWMTVPQDRISELATHLGRHRALRLCASTLGRENVVATLWLREISDLDEIEASIRSRFPEAAVTDRWMVPRTVKRMGTVFDSMGRRARYVPVPLPQTS
jgi:DNA-binding Lrp family transcriptional regulator